MPAHTPASSATAERLTHANENIELFDASRDGKWLVYDSDLAGHSDIFRKLTAGGEPERLTSNPTAHFAPTMSPDAREVAYHSWGANGTRELFVLRLEDGSVQQLTNSAREEANPRWSPDGRALTFADLDAGGGVFVVRRDASGRWGTPVQRTMSGTKPDWSPDSRNLAFVVNGSIAVASADSGPPRTIVDASAPGAAPVMGLAWGDDGRIYYQAPQARGDSFIWSVDPAGGAPRQIVRFDPKLHPANRGSMRVRNNVIYFLGQERESDIWSIELRRP